MENNISIRELGELQLELKRLREVVDAQKANEDNLSIVETRYRQHIIRWFDRLTFQGMMRTAQAISLPLEDVYVELRAVGEVPEAADTFSVEERRLLLEIDDKDEKAKQELIHHMDALRRERWSRTSIERKSITEALFKPDQRAFVILGDPGSGKSTLLHLLALVYARGVDSVRKFFKAPPQEVDRLPIFIPLAAYDDMLRTYEGLTLLEFLPIYFDRRRMITGLEPLFRRALESGKALLLLDGLDEVLNSTTRSYVASQVTALINEYAPRGVRFVMTSRFVGYRDAPVGGDIPHLSVLDFGKGEIKTFIHQWAHTYEKFAGGGAETPETVRLAHQLEKNLFEDVESIPSVRRLAANPLMLTMLALLRRQVGRLPHRRIDLYKRYMDTIIENWVEARSHGEREHLIRMIDPHEAESLLIPLAYWLQSTQPSGTASKNDIQSALADIYLKEDGLDSAVAQRAQRKSAEERAQQFLIDMRNMSGIIVERGYDAFGFLHLTFQEYFAGRALAQMEPESRWEAIAPHLHDSRWREPILLCAGQLGTVEKRKQLVTKFVEKIIFCDDPTEDDLSRNLLLALSIACDDVNLEQSLLNEIVDKSMACLSSNVSILVGEIIRKLGQLILNGVSSAEACLSFIAASKDFQLVHVAMKALKDCMENPDVRGVILQFLDDKDESIRSSAVNVLASLVSSDVDVRGAILQRLDDKEWYIRSSAVDSLASLVTSDNEVRSAILNLLDDKNGNIRSSAVGALASLVSSDIEVRGAILNLLGDKNGNIRSSSVGALASLVSSDVDVRGTILQLLDDKDGNVRSSVVGALASLVSSDANVRRAILQRLDDKDRYVRISAVRALASLVPSDAEVRGANLRLLNDKDGNVRSSVVGALATLVSSDADVRGAVLRLLNDEDGNIRSSAVRALASLVSTNADVRRDVINQLKDVNWKTRSEIIHALAQTLKDSNIIRQVIPLFINAEQFLHAQEAALFVTKLPVSLISSDVDVRGAILKLLDDRDGKIRSSAVNALASLVSSDADVRGAVLQLLNDQEWYVRRSVIGALASLVSSDVEVRGAILQLLDDKDEYIRSSTVGALASLVSSDADVRGAILQRLDDEDENIRSSAVDALASLVSSDVDVRGAILQRLNDQEWYVRSSAIDALASLVSSDANVRRIILQLLDDKDEYIRSSAVSALASLVSSDTDVRRAILQRLDDKDGNIRSSAVGALASLVSSDTGVRGAILQCLDDKDGNIRSSAVGALTSLVSSDADVRRAILERLDDQEWYVRSSAFIAISSLEKIDVFEKDNRQKLVFWLASNHDIVFGDERTFLAKERFHQLFGARLLNDASLRELMLDWLKSPRWQTRLGAVRTLLYWPGGVPNDIMLKIKETLDDNRGFESYPARLAAASYLVNRDPYGNDAIQLGLEALEYGTLSWEYIRESGEVRKQAALMLGTLEPVRYNQKVYDKLLQAMKTDQDTDVRDTLYTTLVKLAGIRSQSLVVMGEKSIGNIEPPIV